MRALISKEMNGQLDEIITIACYKTTPVQACSLQVLFIIELRNKFVQRANGVDSVFSRYPGDFWT